MQWTQPNAHYLESTCNRYTVDKATSGRGFRYTAWRRVPKRDDEKYDPLPINLGCFDSAALAKAQCDEDERLLTHSTNKRQENDDAIR
jgi:hypothetical protein